MKTVDLVQGSPEWHAHRATHWNASDAPAMMGCSPYKTRAELLRELHTGLAGEVDSATQRIFDAGHRFEALARPLAEELIGDDLYPCVGVEGRYSASFDGLTLGGETLFEHKTLSEPLRYTPWDEGNGDHLPLHYRVQMEHQLMVSGAERVLFMASRWSDDGELIEERHCWYAPDAELRAQIIAGWIQLERDLAAYVPPAVVEPPRAEAMESLPAVAVRLDGALTVAGNLPTFAEALRAFIDRIPKKPTNDNEFATVDAACKALKKAEEALDAAEAGALASITDVEAMRRAVADCRKLARDTRLAAEKLVDRRKTEIKEQAVLAARAALDKHIADLNGELAPMALRPVAVDFAGAIKGLRSIASMQDALDTALAGGKIAADAQARGIRANVAAFKAATGEDRALQALFADLGQLVHKAADDFAAVLDQRITKHRADEAAKEAERQRQENERRAREVAEAEERARQQERDRLAAEQRVAAMVEAGVAQAAIRHPHATPPFAGYAGHPIYNPENPPPEFIEAAEVAAPAASPAPAPAPLAPLSVSEPVGTGVALPMPTHAAPQLVRPVPTPAANEPATLTLGMICERLQCTVRADFLADVLHVSPAKVEGRRPGTYTESQFQTICTQLRSHIGAMAELYGQQRAA